MELDKELILRVRDEVLAMFEVKSWAEFSAEESTKAREIAQDLYDIGILYKGGNLTLDMLKAICN